VLLFIFESAEFQINIIEIWDEIQTDLAKIISKKSLGIKKGIILLAIASILSGLDFIIASIFY